MRSGCRLHSVQFHLEKNSLQSQGRELSRLYLMQVSELENYSVQRQGCCFCACYCALWCACQLCHDDVCACVYASVSPPSFSLSLSLRPSLPPSFSLYHSAACAHRDLSMSPFSRLAKIAYDTTCTQTGRKWLLISSHIYLQASCS